MKLRDVKLQVNEQSSFTHPPSFMYFGLSFSEYIRITSSEEALKMCQHNFFQKIKRKVVLLVIYLFNYDSYKSTLFIWHLTFSWVQLLSNKWEFFVSCNSFCSVFWDVLFYKNVIVLHHGEWNIIFYFNICIKFTLFTISQRWRNDKISRDACYKTIKLNRKKPW